jgi:hypothetical protein
MEAKRANVIQIAFSTAFGYRQYVIRIPQTLADPRIQTPVLHEGQAGSASSPLDPDVLFDRIQPTVGAYATVTL